MFKKQAKPVVHSIYDKISGVEFDFAASAGRKVFSREHREHYDQYGNLADSVYGAVEDMGRGMQALTAQDVSLGKAFRAAASEVDKKYGGFSPWQITLIQNMLVKFWERGPELQGVLQGHKEQPARLAA